MIPSHLPTSFDRFSALFSGRRFVFVNALGLGRKQIAPDMVLSEGVAEVEIDILSDRLAKESFEKAIQGDERLARVIPASLSEQAVSSIREDMREILGSIAQAASEGNGSANDQMKRLIQLTAEKIAKRVCESIEHKSRILDLQVQVEEDPLTGLSNRRALDKKLPEEIERADKTGKPLCVLIFDLDWFKQVNDTHGHQAGDNVLKEMACRLQQILRGTDVLVRTGGDEIVMALEQDPISVENESGVLVKVDLGASIGIGIYEGKAKGQKGEDTIQKADRSQYVLKGLRPDKNGKIEQRRGQIAVDDEVFTHGGVEAMMRQVGRESENTR